MTIEQQVAAYLSHLDQRVSRLETLEASGGGVGGGDLFLIETKTLLVDGIIQFLNIPATVKSIFYTGFLLGSGTNMAMIMNAGTSALDLSNIINITCGFAGGATTLGNVRMGACQSDAGIGVPSDVFSAVWGWIPDIQDTVNATGTFAFSGMFYRDDFVHGLWQAQGGGNWAKTGAITQIDLVHDGGVPTFWQVDSRFTLYGLTS